MSGHRGPAPGDEELFGPRALPALREAVHDLSWLLGRGYSDTAAVKLVGDRLGLTARQRIAVMRASCSSTSHSRRLRHELPPAAAIGQTLYIDGFNLLTTLEVALSGGFVFMGRDGCLRDVAGVHGSYRRVEETLPAATIIGEVLLELGAEGAVFYLDSPVSNSGRLRQLLLAISEERGYRFAVELVPSPDAILAAAPGIVVTADGGILDRCGRWLNLSRRLVTSRVPEARLLDLWGEGPTYPIG